MKLKRNQIVRIKGDANIPVRYWGRLARVKTLKAQRKTDGKFSGTSYVIQPKNKKTPLVTSKSKLLQR
jgi:hypothetical protein